MTNRSWRDIIAEMLEIAKEPVGKTMLMYKATLSFDSLRIYLELLLTKQLIAYNEKTRKYKTTKKGLEYLRLNDSMNSIVGRDDISALEA